MKLLIKIITAVPKFLSGYIQYSHNQKLIDRGIKPNKISHTCYPDGWTGQDNNSWYQHIHQNN